MNVRVYHKKFYKTNLRQVADELRVEVEDLDHALAWTPEQLTKHLSSFPAVVLDMDAKLRLFRGHQPEGVTLQGF